MVGRGRLISMAACRRMPPAMPTIPEIMDVTNAAGISTSSVVMSFILVSWL